MLAYYLSLLETPADKRLFFALYQENNRKLEKYAMYILHDQYDAEDAMQNAYVQMLDHFSDIYNVPSAKRFAWMKTITRNEALKICRGKKKVIPVEQPTIRDSIDELLEDVTNYDALLALFDKLPEIYRRPLQMQLISHYSGAQIASLLGISESNVYARISRAKTTLRSIVEREGFRL